MCSRAVEELDSVGFEATMVKVGVIGAGVNGLGCAIKIKEKYPKFDVSSHTYTIPTIFLS